MTNPEQEQDTCRWEWDVDGYYNTECKQAFCIMDGTLEENDFKYCTYCGREIQVDE